MDEKRRRMQDAMTITHGAHRLLILEWLPPGEVRTGTQLAERLLSSQHGTIPIRVVLCNSASDVLENIEVAAKEIETNGVPIIHIEAHGDDGTEYPRGLVGPGCSASFEILEWSQLATSLRKLNLASGFDLLVVAAACFGDGIVLATRPFQVAPFAACIGFVGRVNSSSLREAMIALYTELLVRGCSIEDAVAAANRELYDPSEKLSFIPLLYFVELVTAMMLASRASPESRFRRAVAIAASLNIMGQPGMYAPVHHHGPLLDQKLVRPSLRTL